MKRGLNFIFILFIIVFLLFVATAFCDEGCGCGGKTNVVATIQPTDAMKLIQNLKDSPSFIILDVRTPEEYQRGHIEGAVNMNFYDDNFKKQVSELNRSKTYLVYCHSGARSGRAVDLMKRLKFTSIYNLAGGIVNWEKYNLPVTTK